MTQRRTRTNKVRWSAALLFGVLVFTTVHADGVSWNGGVTAVYQDSDDSVTDADLTVSADLVASLRQRGGEWLLYVEASSSPRANGVSSLYPTVNGDANSVLTSDGDGGVQISEFNYTFFLNQDRRLMVGLIDPSAWLDRGRIANNENEHFINGSFVNNATIEFPDYTIGGVFRVLGKGSRPEMTFILSGSDGIAEVPDRSYQDLLDLNADDRGVFFGAGASWLRDRSAWRLGTWLRSDEYPDDSGASTSAVNYGVYGVYGRQQGANAFNLRLGFANPDVATAEQFVSVAYQRQTALGLFGVGVAHTNIAGESDVLQDTNALDSEIFFRFPVFDGTGHITPSIQYVEVPAVDTEAAVPSTSALVAGLRFHWFF